MYTNRKFGILHRLPSRGAELLEQYGIFYVLERMRFPFVEGYLSVKVTLRLDWSVVDCLGWVPYTWETGDVYSIDAHEYVSRENHRAVPVVHQEMVVAIVSGHFTRANAEATFRYYRWSSKSVASSRQSPASSPAPSGLDDFYGDNLDDD